MTATPHGFTWDQVRSGSTADLSAGDTWIQPAAGTVYRIAADGSVQGHGWNQPGGVAWTAQGWDKGKIVARSHDGRELTQELPAPARPILIVRTA